VHALIDGDKVPALPCPADAIVKGDSKVLSIAAASIIAKVTRDRVMSELDLAFPGYGWARNKGYGTADHMQALARLGPSVHHRTSFAPIAQLRQAIDP
jgi:ribonuclease HII